MSYTKRAVRPGQLNRRIKRVTTAYTTNGLNEQVAGEETKVEYPAAMRHSSFDERDIDDQQQGTDLIYWIVRYRDFWKDRTAHIEWEGEQYDILGAREIDRRHYMEIKTRRVA